MTPTAVNFDLVKNSDIAQFFQYENYRECYKKLTSISWSVLFTLRRRQLSFLLYGSDRP